MKTYLYIYIYRLRCFGEPQYSTMEEVKTKAYSQTNSQMQNNNSTTQTARTTFTAQRKLIRAVCMYIYVCVLTNPLFTYIVTQESHNWCNSKVDNELAKASRRDCVCVDVGIHQQYPHQVRSKICRVTLLLDPTKCIYIYYMSLLSNMFSDIFKQIH